VKLTSRRFSWSWPEGLPASALRPWLLQQLRAEGEPLRWAITGVEPSPQAGARLLQVEAVLVSSQSFQ